MSELRVDFCGHSGCGFGARLEYCEQSGTRLDKSLRSFIGALDMFVFSDERYPDGLYNYRDGRAHREYTFEADTVNPLASGPVETTLSIYHQRLRPRGDSYAIRVTNVSLDAAESHYTEADYLLEQYAQGPMLTTVWERDMAYPMGIERPMVAYDLKTLIGTFVLAVNALAVSAAQ